MKLFLLLTLLAGAEATNFLAGHCSLDACENGATCKEVDQDHHFCECIDSNHYGLRCEYNKCQNGSNCPSSINICERDRPCLNDGICTNTDSGFHCECPSGYSGERCEIQDFCGSCLNGYCAGNKCFCDGGWTGDKCDEDIDECVHFPCSDGATCLNQNGTFKCICPEGRRGHFCESSTCSNDRECFNGGVCDSHACVCTSGFTGANCELEYKNPCTDVSCSPSKVCLRNESAIMGFSCVCPPGKTGRFCELPIDNHYSKPNKTHTCLVSGCSQLYKNGICDQECNHFACGFDGGDCSAGKAPFADCRYAESCARRFHDGTCDPICNNEACLFDGFDCLGPVPEIHKKIKRTDITLIILVKPETFVRKVDDFLSALADRLKTTVSIKKTNGEMDVFEWDNKRGAGERVRFGSRTDARVEYSSRRKRETRNGEEEEVIHGTMVEIQVDLAKCKSCFSEATAVAKFIEAAEASEPIDPEMPIHSAVVQEAAAGGSSGFSPILAVFAVAVVAVAGTAAVVTTKRRNVISAPVWYPPPPPSKHARSNFFGQYVPFNALQNIGEPYEKMANPVFKNKPAPEPNPASNPLELAAEGAVNITPEMVEFASTTGRYERTPLHWLALNKEKSADHIIHECNIVIISFQVDINAQDYEENTALHYACQNARPSLVRRLLEAGADPSIENKNDMTPLHIAAHNSDDMCMGVLLEHNSYKDKSKLELVDIEDRTALMIYAASSCKSIRGAELLVKAGADVNYSGDKKRSHLHRGMTALHHAAKFNTDNKEMFEFLVLKMRANKDAQDVEDATPLWLAVNRRNSLAVDVLLKAGASLDFPDQMGKTPQQLADAKGYRDIHEKLRVASLTTRGLGLPSSMFPSLPSTPITAPPIKKARRVPMAAQSSYHSTPSPAGLKASTSSGPSFADSPHSDQGRLSANSSSEIGSPVYTPTFTQHQLQQAPHSMQQLQHPMQYQPVQQLQSAAMRPSPPYDTQDPNGFNHSLHFPSFEFCEASTSQPTNSYDPYPHNPYNPPACHYQRPQ